jgi:hypothetical protein
LHLDGSPHVIRLRRPPYDTPMPGAGAVHHIKSVESSKDGPGPVERCEGHTAQALPGADN